MIGCAAWATSCVPYVGPTRSYRPAPITFTDAYSREAIDEVLIVPLCGIVAGVAPIEPTWIYGTGTFYLAHPLIQHAAEEPEIPSSWGAGVAGPIVAFAGREVGEFIIVAPGYKVDCMQAQDLFADWTTYRLQRLPLERAKSQLADLKGRLALSELRGDAGLFCPPRPVPAEGAHAPQAIIHVDFTAAERAAVTEFFDRGFVALERRSAAQWDVGVFTPTPELTPVPRTTPLQFREGSRTPSQGTIPQELLRP